MSIASQLSFSTATSLLAGAAGSIPYQTASSATTFLAIGTNGYVLTSNGTAPYWAVSSGGSSGSSTSTNTILQTANATYYPTFVDANNASSTGELFYTTGSFTINPGTGNIGINTTVAAGLLTVNNNSADGTSDFTKGLVFTNNTSGAGPWTHAGIWTVGSAGFAGSLVFGTDNDTVNNRTGITERLRITSNGGISFGATGTAYGTSGQILKSNGDAAPTWVDQSTLATPTPAALTMNNGGAGDASGTTFNGGTARTISYNTVGASKAPASAYNGVYSLDSRAVVDTPTSRDAGLYVDFKANTTDSLGDGGTYHGVLTFRSYGASTDISGGQIAQIGYTDNGNLWHRLGSSTTAWGSWYKIINTNNATTTNIQFQSLGVGTAASGTTGEIRATNEITAYYSSDVNLKENIKLIVDPLGKLEQIRGVSYDWKDEHIQKRGGEDGYFVRKHDIGVIAQEVEAVLPEIVATRDDGTKVVKYEKLVALLIEAVKDQQRQINQISQALQNMAVK